jgi:Trk K+ transport system NAD-binding subunit
MDIPVIADDATREAALLGAGIKQARTLVVCTQNDSLNLQIALKAQRFNPSIRVVIRIFDDDFAQALQDNFGFRAFSSTGTAAPVFASAAAGVDMTRPITVEGEPLSLAQMGISPQSNLNGLSVERIEADYNVSVVLLRHDDDPPDYHPPPNVTLAIGDTIAVLGGTIEISRLAQDNNLSG